MWVFYTGGMVSVVLARVGNGKSAKADPSRVMVRGRMKSHLQNLKDRFPAILGGAEILESQNSDYRWRMIIPKTQWVGVATSLAESLDYTNYKNAAHSVDNGGAFYKALGKVWGIMLGLQRSTLDDRDMFDTVSTGEPE